MGKHSWVSNLQARMILFAVATNCRSAPRDTTSVERPRAVHNGACWQRDHRDRQVGKGGRRVAQL